MRPQRVVTRWCPPSPLALSILALCGCVGQVGLPGEGARPGGPGETPGGGGGGPGGGVVAPLDCSRPVAPRTPLRRLTRFEYNNTVRDIFKITTNPADALPGEEQGNGFGNDANSLNFSRIVIDGYRTVAHGIATASAKDVSAAAALAGCSVAPLDEAGCSGRLITTLGAQLYRRPLEQREIASLTAVYTMGRATGDFASGTRAVIERILQSPQFLYRIELGEPADQGSALMRPSPYEMASRLSYFFWGSAPDAELMQAAAAGGLRTKEQVLAQAQRMVANPKARDVVRFFHGMLYGIRGLDQLVRDTSFYPTFKPGMGALFRRETEAFIDHVIWEGSGTFNELMTAPYTFVNGALATYYGLSGVTGDAFVKKEVDTTRRSGLLTQASILSITTPGSRNDPVVRGKWIYTNMLCGTVADPPMGVPPPPEPVPGVTTRQRFEMHRASDECRGCHTMLDPIGFGFEHFDGAGLWRDTENGLPIDDTGTVATTDIAGDFRGAVELARKLGQSRDAQNCFVGKWLTFAAGRAELRGEDACTRASMQDAFAASGGDIKRLMVAVTQTDAFLYGPAATPAAQK